MTAVDQVLHKLEQQLRKYKEKIQGRHRSSSGKQFDSEEEVEAESVD